LAFRGLVRGGPVFNFRSEGGGFDENNRRFVPASAFFEFTRQEISKSQAPLLAEGFALHAIAGIRREGSDNHPPAFAMPTLSQSTRCGVPSRRLACLDRLGEDRARVAAASSGCRALRDFMVGDEGLEPPTPSV
jgi:hypothetical protein